MKRNNSKWMMVAGAAALAWTVATAQGQTPVIASFGSNGELVCTNLQPGSTASVVWASSLLGPWTNSAPGLDAVTADTNGAIRVSVPVLAWSVPMFCRVWGTPPTTNPPAPAGMVLIPAGPFTMGNTFPGEGSPAELPLHTNEISAFYMDKYEVSKALWNEVWVWARTHGYDVATNFSNKATDHPANLVTWHEAAKWCNARSEREGRVSAYYTSTAQTTVYRTGTANVQNDWVKWSSGYRLPTEAEWEKAARGGTSRQRFPWGNDITHSLANYYSTNSFAYDTSATRGFHPAFDDGAKPYTNPVGYFAPNGYGLYDMEGNVREWMWDWAGGYTASPATDPHGPTSGSSRVVRGGSWIYDASFCRLSSRGFLSATTRDFMIGFRCVLPPDQ